MAETGSEINIPSAMIVNKEDFYSDFEESKNKELVKKWRLTEKIIF